MSWKVYRFYDQGYLEDQILFGQTRKDKTKISESILVHITTEIQQIQTILFSNIYGKTVFFGFVLLI